MEYYGYYSPYGQNDYRNYLMHYGVKGMKWGKHLFFGAKTGFRGVTINKDKASAAMRLGYSGGSAAKKVYNTSKKAVSAARTSARNARTGFSSGMRSLTTGERYRGKSVSAKLGYAAGRTVAQMKQFGAKAISKGKSLIEKIFGAVKSGISSVKRGVETYVGKKKAQKDLKETRARSHRAKQNAAQMRIDSRVHQANVRNYERGKTAAANRIERNKIAAIERAKKRKRR